MCLHPTQPAAARPPQPGAACPAQELTPPQRQQLALDALAGTHTVTELARQAQVSRKFVYQQADKAHGALEEAFAPAPAADRGERVLFHLPVTQAWLQQLTLGLVLICHSSYRGVVELVRDLFDYRLSLGTVHNIVHRAVPAARARNEAQDLAAVRLGAHDELFQADWPVLVGLCAHSTYCYLLSQEECRDADTWAVRLLELADRGFRPEATVADGGPALRAGQREALPGVPCRGDVFHPFYEDLGPLVRYLENRAYEAIAACDQLERKQAQYRRQKGRSKPEYAQKLRYARPARDRAIALAEEVALLVRWLRQDVLPVAGPDHATRVELYDFIVAELRARAPGCPHRLNPVCALLEGQRDRLLAFAAALDQDLQAVAEQFQIAPALARAVLQAQALDVGDRRRWPREAQLRTQLGGRYHGVSTAVAEVARRVVRASSVAENLNSRLRPYFFLRRQLGPDYLALLQFFLNHRRFLRSEHPEREGKSPAELLTGEGHAHWLELLGYRRFTRESVA